LTGNSPPQPRRGGAKRRGVVGQQMNFFGQHHPSRGFYLGFALSGSRFALGFALSGSRFVASTLPSSAEEGSTRLLFVFALLLWIIVASPVFAQEVDLGLGGDASSLLNLPAPRGNTPARGRGGNATAPP